MAVTPSTSSARSPGCGSSVTGGQKLQSQKPATKNERPKGVPYKRSYVACLRCRSRKVKCDLDAEPPCAKCRREHRECVFKSDYKTGRQRQPPRWVESSHEPEMTVNNTPAPVGLTEDMAHAQPSTTRDKGFSSNVSHQSAGPRPSLMERAMSKIMIVPKSDDVLATPFPADSAIGLEDMASNISSASTDCSNLQAHLTEQAIPSAHGDLDLDVIRQPLAPGVSRLSKVEDKTLEAWSRYSLVRQRWLLAQEAVTLADLFFEYLSPMSPVLMSEYKNHSTHQRLITEEPMLCTTILMISSRFFVLPGAGGVVRSYMIHQRLWQCCRGFIEQVVLGRGTYSAKRTSVLSIIDSCLLITDWHPRYADFPSEDEIGGDLCPSQQPDQPYDTTRSDSHLIRWREDILEPSKQSDHFSWMLLGIATNLACKSGLFSDGPVAETLDPKVQARSIRTTKLLYVYLTNLSVRLSCPSHLPENSIFPTQGTSAIPRDNPLAKDWDFFMDCWLELVRLIKTASVLFFESPASTQKQLLTGHYAILLDHFGPSLTRWQAKFATYSNSLPQSLRDLLLIEFQNLRVYTHALSMQAIVERALACGMSGTDPLQTNITSTCFSSSDYVFLQEVVNGASEILKTATKMALSGNLRYMPVRQSLCFISAAIFLLKAISIGSGSIEIQASLDVLDDCIVALRSSPIDDMDFSSRFATLIEKRVAKFRDSFMVVRHNSNNINNSAHHQNHPDDSRPSYHEMSATGVSSELSTFNASQDQVGPASKATENLDKTSPGCADWWARPFDKSIAPFSSSGNFISSGLELDSLDFLWNLPMENQYGELFP
ncbi:uncharacterized protein Z520_08222 [Fonsecaea multimorphosa CBS 102226]|uniref:Zn(2)-C6 fungal-type domain-containing protein n=1 Tax=Fonsecaea multimorphosa CBS 102226 TaxID=1442371 RepID=A0A0D2JRE0_9EURO|nr:uncharacterized protein Z520_08222 [Fonsecaea multimorphosa CBS 102226]KIX95967.1 hypothetical protein Z520_08222 [Fonsecaea multimorphosa CBS 102226]OAL21738.1 hypothetical protein AYO22_07680 [Fonsecaea multimorphosa]